MIPLNFTLKTTHNWHQQNPQTFKGAVLSRAVTVIGGTPLEALAVIQNIAITPFKLAFATVNFAVKLTETTVTFIIGKGTISNGLNNFSEKLSTPKDVLETVARVFQYALGFFVNIFAGAWNPSKNYDLQARWGLVEQPKSVVKPNESLLEKAEDVASEIKDAVVKAGEEVVTEVKKIKTDVVSVENKAATAIAADVAEVETIVAVVKEASEVASEVSNASKETEDLLKKGVQTAETLLEEGEQKAEDLLKKEAQTAETLLEEGEQKAKDLLEKAEETAEALLKKGAKTAEELLAEGQKDLTGFAATIETDAELLVKGAEAAVIVGPAIIEAKAKKVASDVLEEVESVFHKVTSPPPTNAGTSVDDSNATSPRATAKKKRAQELATKVAAEELQARQAMLATIPATRCPVVGDIRQVHVLGLKDLKNHPKETQTYRWGASLVSSIWNKIPFTQSKPADVKA